MILKYTSLIGKPVIDIQNQSQVGEICDFIFDGDDFGIKAIIVSQKSLFAVTKKVIAAADIVHILKDGIIIENEMSLSDIDELPRIKNLYEKKFFGADQKVRTESGQSIGHIYDYLIDNRTLSIAKFYTKKMFDERIISITRIVSFEGKTITIKDENVRASVEKVAIEAAGAN